MVTVDFNLGFMQRISTTTLDFIAKCCAKGLPESLPPPYFFFLTLKPFFFDLKMKYIFLRNDYFLQICCGHSLWPYGPFVGSASHVTKSACKFI